VVVGLGEDLWLWVLGEFLWLWVWVNFWGCGFGWIFVVVGLGEIVWM
jgi:hypothetical protein